MTNYPSWQYDEMQQVGKDYGSVAEVEAYDARHGKFRDVEKENEAILNSIGLQPDHVVIEFGPGTGAFALQAARRCAKVYAVDISRAMLECARMKAERDGLTNIVFCNAGFLSYVHTGQLVDVIVSNMAFHHLPDFWKGIALERMSGMLRYGGGLYLSDVIFEQENVRENIGAFIDKLGTIAGQAMRADVEAHVRQEYSTYDWIMDGFLARVGFSIVSKEMKDGVIGRYLCRKE